MSEAELKTALANWINTKQRGGLTWDIVEAHLAHGLLLLILDGMDEVPLTHGGTKNPSQPRAVLLSGLASALKPWTKQGNRMQRGAPLRFGFDHA